MKQRWLWHLCGALAIFYVVAFWVGTTTSLANSLRLSWSRAVVLSTLALVLSSIATLLGSKRWFPTSAAAFLTLVITVFGRV